MLFVKVGQEYIYLLRKKKPFIKRIIKGFLIKKIFYNVF